MSLLKNLATEFAGTKSLLNNEMLDIKGGSCYRRKRTYSNNCYNPCTTTTYVKPTCTGSNSGTTTTTDNGTGSGTPVVVGQE